MSQSPVSALGDTLKKSMETYFLAPRAYRADIEMKDDRFIIETAGGLGGMGKVIVGFVSTTFLLATALVSLNVETFEWMMLCPAGFGLLGLLVVFVPTRRWRVEVTRDGIRSMRSWERDEPAKLYAPGQVGEVRLLSDEHLFTDDNDIDEWRVGVRLQSGETLGIIEDYDYGRARAVAELVHRLLDAGVERDIPLVTGTAYDFAMGQEAPTRVGQGREPDLDRTLVERSQDVGVSMPLPNRSFETLHTATGVRFEVRNRHPFGTLLAVAPNLAVGGAFAGIVVFGVVSVLSSGEPLPESPETGEYVLLACFGFMPLVLLLVGVGALAWALGYLLGTEYARVEPAFLERGIRFLGRDWARRRYSLSAIEDIRVRPLPIGDSITRGIAVYDGNRRRPFGFQSLSRRDAEWLVSANRSAVGEAAQKAPADIPAGWPEHPRIGVEVEGDEVRIVPRGRRWGWLLGSVVFGASFAGIGLCGTIFMIVAMIAEFQQGELSASVLVIILLFIAVPLFFVVVGAGILKYGWDVFGKATNVHIIRGGELHYEVPAQDELERIELAPVRRVKIDHGNVLLATDTGDVGLGFHKLARAEDLEWARAAVEYAIREYGGHALPAS